MARRRFEQLPEERQDAILRVAAEEFARSGFHGTSYNQLLERLQLGKSSAYYYFDDKRDLFLAAVQRSYARFFAAIQGVEPPRDVNGFWRFVEQSSERGYVFMLEDPTAASLMSCIQREQALLSELGSSELLASIDGFYDDMVHLGQSLGAVRSDVPQDLLVALVRDMAMTFDRWFIAARAATVETGETAAHEVTPASAARAFTEIARRLCQRAVYATE
jgi:AcrR family transcriptional regulator